MKIAFLDQDKARAVIAQVPDYLADSDASSEDIAHAIFAAIGISQETEYMIGEFRAHMDGATYNENGTGMHTMEELAHNFKHGALAALKDITA